MLGQVKGADKALEIMLQHCRRELARWPEATREDKLRTARELLVCTHHTRVREDLVFNDWLPAYLEVLRGYNKYGDFDDPELAISVARSIVNITASEESHLYFVHESNRALHVRLFKEPWLGLKKGEVRNLYLSLLRVMPLLGSHLIHNDSNYLLTASSFSRHAPYVLVARTQLWF